MSSKEDILKRIHANTRQQYDMPDLSLNAIVYEDKLNTFIEVLKAAGGEAYVMQPEDDLNAVIQKFYPDAQRIGSNLKDITCATFNPDELEDPRELNGTDVSIVKGEFGVAENAAVWLPCQYRYKAVYFISNALVIILNREELVNNMNEAYRRIEKAEYSYGVFMSGPSKTADIEQALVFGAHGPIRVTVILL